MLKTDSRIEDATGPGVVNSAALARRSKLRPNTKRRLALTVIVSLMCLPMAALSQAFPSKPIRLIVPFQAGGGNDLLARIISQKFLEKWGQPVIVDNRPGAGGNPGADFVAKAAPDGHTILLGTNTLTMNPFFFAKMPFDTQKDFAPVAMLATTPLYVVVNNDLPVKNIPELIAYAKANPGKLSYATPGIGKPHHLGKTRIRRRGRPCSAARSCKRWRRQQRPLPFPDSWAAPVRPGLHGQCPGV